MDHHRAMQILIAVADNGSFSAAARVLGVTAAAVSKQIARLEDDLGVQLVHRTTRSLSLTEAGRRYVARCRSILDAVADAAREARELSSRPGGTLRLTAPRAFGRLQVAPLLNALVARHPEVQVELHTTDTLTDLVADGIEVAVRIAASLPDSTLRVQRLGLLRRRLVASPSYLQAHGTPASLEALSGHHGLLIHNPSERAGWWLSQPDGSTVRIAPHPRLRVDDLEALLSAARCGLGIAELPDYLTRPHTDSGELVAVLPQTAPEPRTIWALRPPGEPPLRVQRFLELAAEAWGDQPLRSM